MKTCKTCKHWGVDFDKICDFEGLIDASENDGFEVEVSADDDTNLQGQLATGPEFGCVHHEEMEEVSNAENTTSKILQLEERIEHDQKVVDHLRIELKNIIEKGRDLE